MLWEEMRKPTAKEKKKHKCKLYYVITGENGKIVEHIDEEYMKKLEEQDGKKHSPIAAARKRLTQVEPILEEKEPEPEPEPDKDKIKGTKEVIKEDEGTPQCEGNDRDTKKDEDSAVGQEDQRDT